MCPPLYQRMPEDGYFENRVFAVTSLHRSKSRRQDATVPAAICSALSAVSPVINRIEACAKETPSGTGTTEAAGTTMCCDCAPPSGRTGLTAAITFWPGCRRDTLGPTDSTCSLEGDEQQCARTRHPWVYFLPLLFVGEAFFAAFLAPFFGAAFLVAFLETAFLPGAFLTAVFGAAFFAPSSTRAFLVGFAGLAVAFVSGGATGGAGTGGGAEAVGAAADGVVAAAGVSFTSGSVSFLLLVATVF
jgi:hypothetical protein